MPGGYEYPAEPSLWVATAGPAAALSKALHVAVLPPSWGTLAALASPFKSAPWSGSAGTVALSGAARRVLRHRGGRSGIARRRRHRAARGARRGVDAVGVGRPAGRRARPAGCLASAVVTFLPRLQIDVDAQFDPLSPFPSSISITNGLLPLDQVSVLVRLCGQRHGHLT